MKTAHHARRHANTCVEEPGNGRVAIFALGLKEQFLFTWCRDRFERPGHDLTFGIFIRHAAREVRALGGPRRVHLLDGYFTIGADAWRICLIQSGLIRQTFMV